jgi:hypothetical protein
MVLKILPSKGQSHFTLAFLVIFIAAFMLFFIFDSIDKLAQECKGDNPPATCQHMTSLTFPVMIILLIIGGFVLVICITIFIMLR